jgi:uncharacterized protein
MTMKSIKRVLVVSLLFPCALLAQSATEPSPQKTIEISATEKVQVPAETATIKIGYQNQAPSKDAAYANNTKTANQIVQGLLDAGLPKDAIETETLTLAQDQPQYGAKTAGPVSYSANQEWQIYAKAGDAQKIVDIAVAAGANEIESVDWTVADPQKLEERAYAAAIGRAKLVAQQTAEQTGVKLGSIVTIANSTNPTGRDRKFDKELMTVEVSAAKLARPMLKLQAGMVEREASVTITYAIAP